MCGEVREHATDKGITNTLEPMKGVSHMGRTVKKILLEPVNTQPTQAVGKLKVAAYCRVSTDRDEQKTSFEGQVKTYSEKISANPEWEYVGIYADEGVTGTSAEKRPEFMRMVRDCEEGKVNLIMTKSISRFARNTLECITYVRHLNNMGVHLIFENNKIDTRTKFSEMVLTVLAAFAQEESRSISENTSWGIRKRFEEGEVRWNPLYGYEKNEKGEYQIVPEYAAVVQHIFGLYEHGASIAEIRKDLAAKKIPSPKGAETWTPAAVQTLLTNERYAGDILLQKYYTEDFKTHKAKKNLCTEIPSYYVEGHHRPIVPRKQFRRVQAILGMRRCTPSRDNMDNGTCNQYPLGDKLRCPFCGSALYQRTVPVQTKHTAGWGCERGDSPCRGFVIRSAFVEGALLEAYNCLDIAAAEERLGHPQLGKAARTLLEVKKKHPAFGKVDYWWVDELIDHIEFGAHTVLPTDAARMKAMGREFTDDRIMKVFWKCGTVSTVMSGITKDCDQPQYVASLVNARNDRLAAQMEKEVQAG